MKNGLSILCSTLILIYFSNSLFASPIYLFNEPNPNAKIIGKLELSNGMVPIFKPAGSEWMKVSDPQFQQIGWVKINDVEVNGSTVIYNQEFLKQTHAAAVDKIYRSDDTKNLIHETNSNQSRTKPAKNTNSKSETHVQTFSEYIHNFIQHTIQEIVKSYKEINKHQSHAMSSKEQSINENNNNF